ncbi:hypothetical protein T439DRAFT_323847 [Meredithblackwellia eburnea MCA 4105]
MILTNTLLHSSPTPFPSIQTTSVHPQLRDLLIIPPESGTLDVVCYESVARHSLEPVTASAPYDPQFTRLGFAPSTLVYGCGLVAAGGQSSELALMSADAAGSAGGWSHQTTSPGASINNSIHISPSPLSRTTPRLLVSNNDMTIKVYEVHGPLPDWEGAKRFRRKRRGYPSAPPPRRRKADEDQGDLHIDDEEDERSQEGEEEGTWDRGGPCRLEKVQCAEMNMETAINHSSVSPDGRRMVAVGDTNEIFLFDVMHNGDYRLEHTFVCSDDAAFSSDWSGSGDQFAVASQDGYVHLFDVRNLPSAPSSSPNYGFGGASARRLRSLKTSQSGPAGAARKVKFSPSGMGLGSELLAFTEHRSKIHVVDARTFDEVQVLSIPHVKPNSFSLPLQSPGATGLSSPHIFIPSPRTRRARDYERALEARRAMGWSAVSPATTTTAGQGAVRRSYVFGSPEGGRGTSVASGDGASFRVSFSPSSSRSENEDQALIRELANRAWGPDVVISTAEQAEVEEDEEDDGEEEGDEECPPEPQLVAADAPQRQRVDLGRLRVSASHSSNTASASAGAPSSPRPASLRLPFLNLAGDPAGRGNLSINIPPDRTGRVISLGSPGSGGSGSPGGYRHPSLSGYAPLANSIVSTGYQATSSFFPTDAHPEDLLGLDWDECGERLAVATEDCVWMWDVDGRRRRCFGSWGVI